jgi:hypothetical protein
MAKQLIEDKEIDIRSKDNVRDKGEVFTPTKTVDEMLRLFPAKVWKDPAFVFIEPTCGNGQFLVRIFAKRLVAKIPVIDALNTIIGMDISDENIYDSRKRLYDLAIKTKYINAVQARSIIINNIFRVEDSLQVMKDYANGVGVLADKRFVYSDPTGNDQVMKIKERRELEGYGRI